LWLANQAIDAEAVIAELIRRLPSGTRETGFDQTPSVASEKSRHLRRLLAMTNLK
jgi:hypothetical protein